MLDTVKHFLPTCSLLLLCPFNGRGSSGTDIRHHVRKALITVAYRHSMNIGCPMNASVLPLSNIPQQIYIFTHFNSTQDSHRMLHQHTHKTMNKTNHISFHPTPPTQSVFSSRLLSQGQRPPRAELTIAPTLSSPAALRSPAPAWILPTYTPLLSVSTAFTPVLTGG